jgi:uncharacterized membrane protein YbhN (UPF0104 family)
VLVLDDIEPRVRQPRDAMGIGTALLGIAALMLFSAYLTSTTEGVERDVQSVSSLLSALFLVPVVVLETIITLAVPVAVLTELTFRRSGRQVLESAIALALGLTLTVVFIWGVQQWGSSTLIQGMSAGVGSRAVLTIPGYVAGLCGLLTAAGPRTRRRSVSISWNVLWFSLAFVLIAGQVSLAGAFIAVLLGRVAGLTVRYVSGVKSERAQGDALVRGVQRAGFEPISLARVRDVTVEHPGALFDDTIPPDFAAHPLTADSSTRVYAMHRLDGPRLDVVVLDGDRQLIGVLQRLWRSLRLRGIEGRSAISLRSVAERAALLNYAAQSAGVRTHKLLGVSEAEDSMLLVFDHPERAVPLSSLSDVQISDSLMREAWRQLEIAHKAGLSHRGISADQLLVSEPSSLDPHFPALSSPKVWLTGWENGDIASATLARNMDNAQMLAMFASLTGPDRAIAVAREVISAHELRRLGPLLQTVIMPSTTRSALRGQKRLISELRSALVEQIPEADVEPMQIQRFGIKTVITWSITFIAAAVVFTTIQFDQIVEAITTSNPWWSVATLLLGLLTWLGAALTFVGFASVRIPIIKATVVQAAASFVALAAPAGIGPAALNLRMLTRRGVQTSLAVATVALVQVSGFVVTIVLVVILSVASGDGGALRALPSTSVIVVIIAIVLIGAVAFSIPGLRRYLLAKIRPTFNQIWPRLSELLSTPWRLALGLAGNALMTMGYVLAFDSALNAFGAEVSLIDAAVVFLVGNTVGAMAPTPGGLGAIEVALVTGLTTTAGVPAAIATSAVVLFRVATYWARIPIGWVAMRYLQKNNEL